MQRTQFEEQIPYCFTGEQLSEFIKESEESGWADEEEVKAFEDTVLYLDMAIHCNLKDNSL